MNGKIIFVAHAVGDLYEVEFAVERNVFAGFAGENDLKQANQSLWHFRLGHVNAFDMKKMITNKMVSGMDTIDVNTNDKFCETCVLGKHTRKPFSKRANIRSKRVLELIHTDVCGPMSTAAIDATRYHSPMIFRERRKYIAWFIKVRC